MLIHTSRLTAAHSTVEQIVRDKFNEFRNQWRYSRQKEIRSRLGEMWENDFREVIRAVAPEKDISFEKIEAFITPFF